MGSNCADSTTDHLESFGEFFEQLNRAAKAALPQVPRRHARVHVLLLRWEEDDLGTEKEIDDLEEVFRDLYHYETERYVIPSDDSTLQLEDRLNDFRRAHDSEANLLILYYGGHGALEKHSDRPSRSIWKAKQKEGPHLVWSDLQGGLERAKADVVFILDCCFAATASRGGGAKEGLWACNSEVNTTGVNDNSFTRNLIEELRTGHTARFNVAILHARLMRRYRKPGQHQLLTEPWYTYLGDEVLSSVELTPQPVLKGCKGDIAISGENIPGALSEDHGSVATSQDMLSGAPGKDDGYIAMSREDTSSPSSNENKDVAVPGCDPKSVSEGSSTASSSTSITIDEPSTETLVLLAVRLKESEVIPQLDSWQDWCHVLASADVESVHALGRLQARDLINF